MNRYAGYDSGGVTVGGFMFLGIGLGLLVVSIQKLALVESLLVVGAGLVIGLGLGLIVMGMMVFSSRK